MTVGIVATGVANLASVRSAFVRLGAATTVVHTPRDLDDLSHLVLPGVGAFGPAMDRLSTSGLADAVRTFVLAGRPTLGICLGMQLLTEGSEEAPGIAGMSVIPGRCSALQGEERVPHLGWNWVEGDGGLGSGFAAFANSFALYARPPEGGVATTVHGQPFVSAYRNGSLLACQFHPELSGSYGETILSNWLGGTAADGEVDGCPAGGMARRIVACLDVRDGRVMKGVRFQGLRDVGDPAQLAARYAAEGVDEIVVLDISATNEGRMTRLETIRAVRRVVHIPVTAGGGVRSVQDAQDLLEAGADKVSVNTAALHDPSLIKQMAGAFGRQSVVLAVDARASNGGWIALGRSGTEDAGRDAVAWAAEGVATGAGEVLLTSWDRDGTGLGPDVRLLANVRTVVDAPVVASGGMGTAEQMRAAFVAGADAALAATMFHDGQATVDEVKRDLSQTFPIRR